MFSVLEMLIFGSVFAYTIILSSFSSFLFIYIYLFFLLCSNGKLLAVVQDQCVEIR